MRFGNLFASYDFGKYLEIQEWDRELPGFCQRYQNIYDGNKRQYIQQMVLGNVDFNMQKNEAGLSYLTLHNKMQLQRERGSQ